ncbi:MAG: hypothetical protein JXA41_13375 [Deltaproteobacteria bacterium]|nr:hypothetical protein [Deltaproteobacteria bacterium]
MSEKKSSVKHKIKLAGDYLLHDGGIERIAVRPKNKNSMINKSDALILCPGRIGHDVFGVVMHCAAGRRWELPMLYHNIHH